ncbi:MAG: hypothetical protein Q8O03_03255 [Nanoarchaeota archaeon]|nr:hypothetical protein [Nanoarchaeota archaeon]
MNEVMHVGIEQPAERRKEILNIAVDAIQSLKDFEMSRKIRKEKDIYRKEFIRIVTELNDTIQQFKDDMPAVHVTHPHEEEKKEVKLEKKEEFRPIVKKPVKKKTHMDELEDDIARLRERISRL